MNYLLTVSYVGTNYCGWQVQPNAISVQETIQNAIEKLFGKRFPLTGCSRTDAGVHANGFLCSVKTDGNESSVALPNITAALNSMLPDDISVIKCEIVPDSFHPRYDTFGKEYSYHYFDRPERDPFLVDRAWHVRARLDENAMNQAAGLFVGKHDFSAFRSTGSSDKDHIRVIYSAGVVRKGNSVIFTVKGNGFLYNMVRIMAGTLYEIGCGRRNAVIISKALLDGNRRNLGITAPANGLYLESVIRKSPNFIE